MTLRPWAPAANWVRVAPVSNQLLHLDFIRFIASVGVVYHHSHEFFYNSNIRLDNMERSNGLALFVDLFFVISGFIITHYYQDKVSNIKQFLVFLQRRIGRLFPLHWLTLCIMASVFWISAKLGYLPRHSPTLSPACLAKTAMLIQELIPCDGIYVNAVTWSISVEMSMYVLFPILVLVSMKLRVFPMVCAGMILLVIASKSIWHGDFVAFNWEDQNSVVRIFPSFLIGMSFCHYRTLLGKMPQASKVQMILLAGTIIAMMNGAPMLLTLFLVYAVIAASVAADMQRKTSSMVKAFAPFAQLTYSVYMWHSFSY